MPPLPPSGAGLVLVVIVNTAEDTADLEDNIEPVTEEGGEELPFNGVGFGVLPGVAWGREC